jgi:cobalt-zinc-cadmium efflux system protein
MHFHAHGASDHSQHSDSHAPGAGQQMTAILGAAVVATFALVAVELVAGYAGHSIALVSDGVHNLTDVPTLVISWLATRWAKRPPTEEKTYGYHRAGILAAFVNSMLLALVAIFLIYESIERLRTPVEVQTGIMLWVSLLALVVNGGITFAVHGGRWTGATWADPVIGIAIGAMVLWSGRGILLESSHILLEGLPRSIHLEEVAKAMLRVEGVREVHDIHIWTLGTDLNALSCHVCIPDMHMEDSEKILIGIKDVLARDFHITHTTVQFERAGLPADAGLYMPEPVRRSGA